MHVRYIGHGPHFPALDRDEKPLPFEAFGYSFPDRGWVEVSDDDPACAKFLGNPEFDCEIPEEPEDDESEEGEGDE